MVPCITASPACRPTPLLPKAVPSSGVRATSWQVLIPGIIGPAIGAAVLQNAETIINDDGTTSFIPNENIFLAAFVAACVIFLALWPLFRKMKEDRRG